MQERLRKLYATLLQIETKGSNTLMMADCIRYVEVLMAEASVSAPTTEESEGE